MKLVYRGLVRFPLENRSLMSSKSSILCFPKLILQYHLNGRRKHYANWIFQDSVKDIQTDEVAQLEKTFYVLSVRVTDLHLILVRKINVSFRLLQ